MEILDLSKENSLLLDVLLELRDEEIQTDRMRFRHNMARAGQIMAYELSKRLPYEETTVTTSLGDCLTRQLAEQPVLGAILRAALPFHQGFLDMFDKADSAFISAYRKHTMGNEFIVKVEYNAAPDLTDRTLVLLDPMIATGRSMIMCYNALRDYGTPARVFFCGVIASEEGVDYLLRHVPHASVLVGAIDNELTARGYIVPGLGDAGDLAYGEKV